MSKNRSLDLYRYSNKVKAVLTAMRCSPDINASENELIKECYDNGDTAEQGAQCVERLRDSKFGLTESV